MPDCRSIHFKNIKEFTWTRIFKQLSTLAPAQSALQTIDQSGNSGSLQTSDGFKIEWSYDPGTKELNIRCAEKPERYSCEDINQRLSKIVSDQIVAL